MMRPVRIFIHELFIYLYHNDIQCILMYIKMKIYGTYHLCDLYNFNRLHP